MRRKDSGLTLMAVGVLCGIVYILINLRGDVARGGNLLLYAAIALIVAGLIVFAFARVRR